MVKFSPGSFIRQQTDILVGGVTSVGAGNTADAFGFVQSQYQPGLAYPDDEGGNRPNKTQRIVTFDRSAKIELLTRP